MGLHSKLTTAQLITEERNRAKVSELNSQVKDAAKISLEVFDCPLAAIRLVSISLECRDHWVWRDDNSHCRIESGTD